MATESRGEVGEQTGRVGHSVEANPLWIHLEQSKRWGNMECRGPNFRLCVNCVLSFHPTHKTPPPTIEGLKLKHMSLGKGVEMELGVRLSLSLLPTGHGSYKPTVLGQAEQMREKTSYQHPVILSHSLQSYGRGLLTQHQLCCLGISLSCHGNWNLPQHGLKTCKPFNV